MFGQINLRARILHAREQGNHRRPQMERQVIRLIEAAAVLTPGVQRHRNHAVRIIEHPLTSFAHQRAEPWRDRSTAIVFQRMDDVFHPALIGIDCRHPRNRVRAIEVFVNRLGRAHRGPAEFAHGSVKWRSKSGAAGRARRLEQRGQNDIGRGLCPSPKPQVPSPLKRRPGIRFAWRCPRDDRDRRNRARAWRRRGRRSRSSRGAPIRRGRSLPPATAAVSPL